MRAQPNHIILDKCVYGMELSWIPRGDDAVDLDLQAVIVDDRGLIVDAVYYNNMDAMNGAIGLSGDSSSSVDHACETIWVSLSKMPQQVKMVLFVAAAYDHGSLHDAMDCMFTVLQERKGYPIMSFKVVGSYSGVAVVCVLKRHRDGAWTVVEVGDELGEGRHFLDILEPSIGDLIRQEVRGAPQCQKVTFIMEKGAVTDLPQMKALKRLVLGVGATLGPSVPHRVDLDISVVFFSESGKIMGAVDYDHHIRFGVAHSGDKACAGRAKLDDEVITIDMAQVPANIVQMFIVMTIKNATFDQLHSAYARVADQTCAELARYKIKGGCNQAGVIVARLFRTYGNRWGFQALGHFCNAHTWHDAEPQMTEFFKQPPHTSLDLPRKRRQHQPRQAKPPVQAVSEKAEAMVAAPQGDILGHRPREGLAAQTQDDPPTGFKSKRTTCVSMEMLDELALDSDDDSNHEGDQRPADKLSVFGNEIPGLDPRTSPRSRSSLVSLTDIAQQLPTILRKTTRASGQMSKPSLKRASKAVVVRGSVCIIPIHVGEAEDVQATVEEPEEIVAARGPMCCRTPGLFSWFC